MTTNDEDIPQQKPKTPTQEKIDLINEAREVLRGSRSFNTKQLKDMYMKLEHHNQFAYATEVLLVKMKMDEEKGDMLLPGDYQKLALYIYKDHSLPSFFKFKKALQELRTHNDLKNTLDCESLGLAGAIFKRKWQFDHQFKNLILSRYYYKSGYLSWKEYLVKEKKLPKDIQNDDGYTAINYAYINELMAVDKLEEHGETTGLSESIDASFQEAENVRTFILQQFITDINSSEPMLKQDDYPKWVIATVAEAYFGLRKYNQASRFIEQYIQDSKEEKKLWQIKTFNQQLFSIAYLQESQKRYAANDDASRNSQGTESKLQRIVKEIDTRLVYKCLLLFDEKNKNAPGSPDNNIIIPEIKKGGKLGLALSGGGFRASLFHIGVLAALAEKDELRNVEVLSCVSGGSIIGAYYYIKLKKLLELKRDDEISALDYIALVKETESGFLEGVQKNLRVRIFSDLSCNAKMLTDKNYSRTHRLGELYEEHLYKKIWTGSKDIYMSDLFIAPKGTDESFDIANDNWKRRNKIPQLVLNATTVNTGHNWQFTASWMGEPPGNIQADIDVKPRLRRMYYKEAPGQYQKFRLGYAVGASSCVPVMFHPMPMYELYPGIDLQLIDGGLHDNQGIAALIEQECNNMIISDASGQLPTKKVSEANEGALFYRADNILQERLRELQFMDLKERNYTAQLNRLVTMHLKNDLQQNPVNWKNCIDPARTIVYANLCDEKNELTRYGVLKTSQTLLSQIRTDLDSFSDAEAYSLMYSGYLQTHYEWNQQNPGNDTRQQEDLWAFTAIKNYVIIPEKADEIQQVLKTGSRLFFKVPFLSKSVKFAIVALLIGIAFLLVFFLVQNWNTKITHITVKGVVGIVVLYLLGKLSKALGFLLNHGGEVKKWILLFGLAIFGFLASVFYLAILNPIYNRAGKIKKQ